jgi:outer membrane protein TolC
MSYPSRALLLALTCSAPAWAQLSAMSLPEALDYAKQHQPSLKAAQARASGALAETDIPRAQWFPRLGASAQLYLGTANNTTALYTGAGGIDLPRIGATPTAVPSTANWAPYGSTLAAIGVRQEVFDFGRIAAQSAVFDAAASAARSAQQVEALDVNLAVKEAYFAVLAAKAILAASDAAWQRAKEERDDAAARVKAGMKSPIDLTRPEADLMKFDAGRIRARGSLTAAQGVFAAVVGYPQSLLDAAGMAPEAEEPHAAEDPEIAEYEARAAAQRAKTKATLYELLPDLAFTATFSGREGGATPSTAGLPPAPGAGFVPGVPNWDLGLVLNWTFFDEGTFARRKASRAYEAAAEADLEAVKLKTSSAISQARAEREVAVQALPALQGAVDAARANRDQAQARFKVGLGTAVELADADALLVDSEIQVALGRFESDRAQARLARALAEP